MTANTANRETVELALTSFRPNFKMLIMHDVVVRRVLGQDGRVAMVATREGDRRGAPALAERLCKATPATPAELVNSYREFGRMGVRYLAAEVDTADGALIARYTDRDDRRSLTFHEEARRSPGADAAAVFNRLGLTATIGEATAADRDLTIAPEDDKPADRATDKPRAAARRNRIQAANALAV